LPVFGTFLVRSVSGPQARQWRGVAAAAVLGHFISGTTFPKPSRQDQVAVSGTLLLYFNFSALPRSENLWQFIAFNRRHPFAKASKNLLDLCGIGSLRTFLEVFRRAQRGNFFGECERNKLIKSYPLGISGLARFCQQGRGYAKSKIASSHKVFPSFCTMHLLLTCAELLPDAEPSSQSALPRA
jgi:hypothetical protein